MSGLTFRRQIHGSGAEVVALAEPDSGELDGLRCQSKGDLVVPISARGPRAQTTVEGAHGKRRGLAPAS